MKITLTEAQTIKTKDYEPGDEVIVNKEYGERLISEGVANRMIEEPENRGVMEGGAEVIQIATTVTTSGARRFSGHKVFGR